MADWAELSVLASTLGAISRDDFGESLDQAGFLGLEDGGLFPGDETWLDDDATSPDDASERFADELWAKLHLRRSRIGALDAGAFPFELDDAYLSGGSWHERPAYTMLLLLDHGRTYGGLDVAIGPDSAEGRLFEKIVEASAAGLFGGPVVRFGWPIEPDWPTHPRDRIVRLADRLGLEPENLDIGDKVDPHDKDKGLDVVSGWTRLDEPGTAGQAWVLVQCAVGANWKNKTGEPALSEWRDLIAWDGPLLKGVAVPWRELGTWTAARVSRKFGNALVLGRDRLLRGHPDAHLDPAAASEIRDWCEKRVAALPIL